jgi:uncharacterized repeat protein (TIGR03803 family)
MQFVSRRMGAGLSCLFLLTVPLFLAFPADAQPYTVLHAFSGSDGQGPLAGLVQGSDGNFYGTTQQGGTTNYGTVFNITPGGTLTTLHFFSTLGSDGRNIRAGLVQGTDGNFYGTTQQGGTSGHGTVFRITPSGTLTTLYSFAVSDGASPYAGLVQGTDGNFYGTTDAGGTGGYGTVFKITPSGTLTTLHSFPAFVGDGLYPDAALVQGSDGNFYGTTNGGGASGSGTVFKITAGGTLTTLYSFAWPDGQSPAAALIQGSDGNFYGTTYSGGAICSCGTVFKITPAGTLTTLHSFAGSDGYSPAAALIQGTDGNFYGTTYYGGASSYGTVFKITPAGALTTLYSFAGSDGANPYAGLVQGTDGNFYGTTYLGGPLGFGVVFRLTPGFYTVAPCRQLDTRSGSPISPGGTLAVALTGAPCGIPSGATSVSANAVVTQETAMGHLTIYPADKTQPLASTINFNAEQTRANNAILPLSSDGTGSVNVVNGSGGTTHVIIDVNGYFQ